MNSKQQPTTSIKAYSNIAAVASLIATVGALLVTFLISGIFSQGSTAYLLGSFVYMLIFAGTPCFFVSFSLIMGVEALFESLREWRLYRLVWLRILFIMSAGIFLACVNFELFDGGFALLRETKNYGELNIYFLFIGVVFGATLLFYGLKRKFLLQKDISNPTL